MSDVNIHTDLPALHALMDVLSGKTPADPIEATQEFVKTHPERSEGYFVLGVLTYLSGYVGDALQMIERAHEIDPEVREYAQALSSLYAMSDRINDALYFAKLGVVLDSHPDMAGVLPPDLMNFVEAAGTRGLHEHYVEASYAFNRRNFQAVVEECDAELKADPSYIPALDLKARALMELGDNVGAIPLLQDLLQRNAAEAAGYRVDLAVALCRLGLFDQSSEFLHQALQSGPLSIELSLKALSLLPHLPDGASLKAQVWTMLTECGAFDQEPYFPYEPFSNEVIRIGFLSDKCYDCFEGVVLSNLIRRLDRKLFEGFVYIQNINEDYVTQDIKNRSECGRDVYDIDDKTLSLILQRDQIDILVDMCGFGPNQRLKFMAHQPGGMRINWLAPTYGAAMPAISHVVAEDSTLAAVEACLGEGQSIAMLDGPLFARTQVSGYLDPTAPPVEDKGYVTFGAELDFRAFAGDSCGVWARLLEQLPTARLKIDVGSAISEFGLVRLNELFEPLGLSERIELHVPEEGESPGGFFAGIDVFLGTGSERIDTFVEALWMGVPCLTRRRGVSGEVPWNAAVLRAAGIPSWVCESDEDFVSLGVALASDSQELSGLRRALRPQVAQSALMNPDNFALKFQTMLLGLGNQYRKPE